MDPIVIRSYTDPANTLTLLGVHVTESDIQAVFRWLKAWEIAAPFRDYNHLACDEGSAEERAFTQKVIGHDLRQPLYNSRAIWTRGDNRRASRFMKVLERERARCQCTPICDLPFLRAMWTVKPLVLALPVGFIQTEPPATPTRLK